MSKAQNERVRVVVRDIAKRRVTGKRTRERPFTPEVVRE
jgi:hypothetical protein